MLWYRKWDWEKICSWMKTVGSQSGQKEINKSRLLCSFCQTNGIFEAIHKGEVSPTCLLGGVTSLEVTPLERPPVKGLFFWLGCCLQSWFKNPVATNTPGNEVFLSTCYCYNTSENNTAISSVIQAIVDFGIMNHRCQDWQRESHINTVEMYQALVLWRSGQIPVSISTTVPQPTKEDQTQTNQQNKYGKHLGNNYQ